MCMLLISSSNITVCYAVVCCSEMQLAKNFIAAAVTADGTTYMCHMDATSCWSYNKCNNKYNKWVQQYYGQQWYYSQRWYYNTSGTWIYLSGGLRSQGDI